MTPQEANADSHVVSKLLDGAKYLSAPDVELEAGIQSLSRLEAGQFIQRWYKDAREKLQQELFRRKQLQAIIQAGNHHDETIKEIGNVKTAVVCLAGARWIDWAILVATAIAAGAGVILLFRG